MNKTLLLLLLLLPMANLLKAQDCDPDTRPPTPICINGLEVTLQAQDPIADLNGDGELDSFAIQLWPHDFIATLTDNCTAQPFLRIEFADEADDAVVPQTTSIIVTEDNVGATVVQVWAGDDSGNWDYCETYILATTDSDCENDAVQPSAVCKPEVNVALDAQSGLATIEASALDAGSTDNCTASLNFLISLADEGTSPATSIEFNTAGTYLVELTALDSKNNAGQCQSYVKVTDSDGNPTDCNADQTPPLALCSQDQVFTITTLTNPFVLSAEFIAAQSIDNCSSELSYTIEQGTGGSTAPTATFLSFDETMRGLQQVTAWVTDEQGNQSKCTSEINIVTDFTRHHFTGKVFIDEGNCEIENVDQLIGGVEVRVSLKLNGETKLSRIFSTFGDLSPRYSTFLTEYTTQRIGFGSGSNSIEYTEGDQIDVEVLLWENINTNCSSSMLFEDINAGDNNTTNEQDFGISVESPCPELYLDLTTPFLRRCFPTTYWVDYCNYGGAEAKDAQVQITFDDYLEVQGSGIPWSSVDGQTYIFDVGVIPPGDCDRFYINVITSCEAELGQTHCNEAKITHSSECNGGSAYQGPDLELKAKCEGDEVKFQIRNMGQDMTEGHHYIVIEDILMLQDGQTDVLLNGEMQELSLPANGSTFRLEVDQANDYPWAKISGISLEGCGENSNGSFSQGFVTQFSEADWLPSVSVDCQENRGAFDPNDKQAFPKGVGEEKLTKANVGLEYLIRFQNTGTDTAFTVRIEDQLSSLLDLNTVKPGASSHPYSFSIKENRVMEFRFDDILLPDSTTNLEASNGFVKFSVEQMPDNPIGGLIENTAGIYFDFNEPVITNTVQHLIGEPLLSSNSDVEKILIHTSVIPNPFQESTTLQIENVSGELLQLQLFDYLGRKVRTESWRSNQYVLHRKGLPSGVYYFTIRNRKGLLSDGKLIMN